MKLIIPVGWELFGIPHQTIYDDTLDDQANAFAQYSYRQKAIIIHPNINQPVELFFHELAEAISMNLEWYKIVKLPHPVINGFGLGFYNFLVSNLDHLVISTERKK